LGNQKAELSDNDFDLLPNEFRTITSSASLDALNKEQKTISLVDAFAR
jgi:hypothetical protein